MEKRPALPLPSRPAPLPVPKPMPRPIPIPRPERPTYEYPCIPCDEKLLKEMYKHMKKSHKYEKDMLKHLMKQCRKASRRRYESSSYDSSSMDYGYDRGPRYGRGGYGRRGRDESSSSSYHRGYMGSSSCESSSSSSHHRPHRYQHGGDCGC
ncbi:hypothetical protein [Risungbinella massiliensis]|uniref:hypothetical protein n=1 Tax=Risungbinella massiliensis TaxID=1329796 RepID=UPI0011C9E4D4|nr:hypothetical protein [Risungbinella massiliensis]